MGGSRSYNITSVYGGELGFQFRDLGFQRFEASAGAGENYHLAVELFPADQIELAEAALQQGLELRLQFGARQWAVATEQARGVATECIEQSFGWEHGQVPDTDGGSVARSRRRGGRARVARFLSIAECVDALEWCDAFGANDRSSLLEAGKGLKDGAFT